MRYENRLRDRLCSLVDDRLLHWLLYRLVHLLSPNPNQNSQNSYLSSYFIGRFTSNQIPEIPNLSLNSIVMVDTLDSSQILEIGGTLSSVVTGLLPPSGFFTTQGGCNGCNSSSSLTPPSSFSICLLTLFYLFLSICIFHQL